MKRSKRIAPSIPALTPDYSRPVPTAQVVQAHVTPDIAVESVLFHAYLREKARADRVLTELRALKADAKAKKQWARVKRLRKLTPKEKR